MVCLVVLPLVYDRDNALRLKQRHFRHRSYTHGDGHALILSHRVVLQFRLYIFKHITTAPMSRKPGKTDM